MKKILILTILSAFLNLDSSQKKYDFTFTLQFNDISLSEVARIEKLLNDEFPDADLTVDVKKAEPNWIHLNGGIDTTFIRCYIQNDYMKKEGIILENYEIDSIVTDYDIRGTNFIKYGIIKPGKD